MKNNRQYLFEDLLPLHGVSVIAGASGSGKTTLIVELAQCWNNHEPWMGHAPAPREYGDFFYVVADRSKYSMEEKFNRLGVNGLNYVIMDSPVATPSDFFKVIPENAKFVALDCAERLLEGGNMRSFAAVSSMMLTLRREAERRGACFVLMMGTPKLIKDREILHVREHISGSSGWGRFAETIISIVMPDPKNRSTSQERTLHINKMEGAPEYHDLILNEHGFVAALEKSDAVQRIMFLNSLQKGKVYNLNELEPLALAAGLPTSALRMTLTRLIQHGMLIRPARGTYQLPSEEKS